MFDHLLTEELRTYTEQIIALFVEHSAENGQSSEAKLTLPLILGSVGRAGSMTEMNKAKRIDVTSRILFPLVFAVFNMSYWSFYLMRAQEEFELTQRK